MISTLNAKNRYFKNIYEFCSPLTRSCIEGKHIFEKYIGREWGTTSINALVV